MRILLCMLLLMPGDPFADAMRAYEEGRFSDAVKLFLAAESELGEGAPAELLHDLALAALRAGDLRLAESSAEKAVVRGGPRFVPQRHFILGNVAFKRCLQAEILAGRVEAGPVALDAAILHAETAAESWRRAAVTRSDWPAARRNVERALLKLETLRKTRDERRKKQGKKPKNQPPKPPSPERQRDPSVRGRKINQDRLARMQLKELSYAQVRRLLEKLSQKEAEKAKLRKKEQAAKRVSGERDW
ncbi:MAG: hypothetical protein CMJ90_13705 [Planctomycetes bacterium]|nr:hypothetical protein [Planctomycetota bacterium]